MTEEDFYELVEQVETDAKEFAKDEGEFKHILENAYALGAMLTLRKIADKIL